MLKKMVLVSVLVLMLITMGVVAQLALPDTAVGLVVDQVVGAGTMYTPHSMVERSPFIM